MLNEAPCLRVQNGFRLLGSCSRERGGDVKMASDRGPTNERPVDAAVFPDDDTLMRAEAEHVARLARAATAARGRFLLAFSGGSTPRRLYELLSRPPFLDGIDWARVYVFWGDERCVPPDHPQSNYRMAREALLDRVPLPKENVFRLHGEDDPPPRRRTSRYSASSLGRRRGRPIAASIRSCWAWAATGIPPRCFRARRRSPKGVAG